MNNNDHDLFFADVMQSANIDEYPAMHIYIYIYMSIMASGRKCLYYTLRPYLLRWAAPARLATAVPGPLSPATRPLMGLGTSGDRRPGVHGPRNKNKASRAKRVASVFYFPPEARAI